MYRLPWRTAKPLEPLTTPGCDNPTSRCQTTPSIGSLKNDEPVIPGVPFIRWAMTFSTQSHRITITDFHPCSICQSFSQANLYYCALQLVYSIWAYLRTPPLLFRRRPPQSNYPLWTVLKSWVTKIFKSGISFTFKQITCVTVL